ncbi:MAG: hypothetical protein WCF84_21145 [Anaerolineae bacterium]
MNSTAETGKPPIRPMNPTAETGEPRGRAMNSTAEMGEPPVRPYTRCDVLLILLMGALVALFFWRILTPNPADRAQFPPGDFTDQFYAFRLVEARAFASGYLPLWSESYNSGHPFLADIQSAVFYPVGLANTLLNVAFTGPNFSLFSLELEALLHFWLAGVFTYLLARRLIGTRPGAFAAGVVFTFGGYLTSYPSLQLAILETATWLPLALLWLDLALSNPRRRGTCLAAAGLTLGVAALAGHPQTFLFVLVTCTIFWLYRVLSSAEFSWRRFGWAAGAFLPVVVVALGLAAVQLIPAVEYQRLSTRESLSFREAAAGFPTLDLLQFVFPGFTSAFASPLYVGVLPLWLALVALVRGRRERTFWGMVALVALILSFGYYVFAYAVLYQIPGVGLFRQQERLAFVVSFALALLAGFGLQDLVDQAAHLRVGWARRLFLLLPAGAAVSFALLVVFFVAGVQQASGRIAFLGDRAGLMLLLFALASAGVGIYLRRSLSPRLLIPVAIALILFDLWSVNEPANKAAPGERYAASDAMDTLRADPDPWRVLFDGQTLPGHMGIGYQVEEIGGISPLRLARYDDLLNLNSPLVWRLLNVKYVYGTRPNVPNAELIGQEGELRLWRLKDPAPRAWLVGRAESNLTDEQALERLATGFDERHVALLAGSAPFTLSDAAAAGQATITLHQSERIVIDANAPADGLLMVSENDYPGWVARVDGVPTEILRADLTLSAVPLRAGLHHVELVYDPLSVKIGMFVSAAALLLAIGICVWPRRSVQASAS